VFVGEDGRFRLCCQTLGEESAVNVDAHGTPYTISGDSEIAEAWNSPFMKNLRVAMRFGKPAAICKRCVADEALGIRSYRQAANSQLRSLAVRALAQTKPDGWAPPRQIRSFDIRLGNLCNLRCRFCSPASTLGLIDDYAALNGLGAADPAVQRYRKMTWPSDPAVWQRLENYIPRMKRLHFAGGEPLLSRKMFDFLERIVESGCASHTTLSYVTNLTVLPQRALDLWPHFRRVSLNVSLDGRGEVNSLLRYPSDWAALDRNLHILDEAAPRLNAADGLTFNATVQIQNVFRLDELIEYAAGPFQHFGRPRLSLLYYPEHFSIQVLPVEMKAAAARRLRLFAERFQHTWPSRWPASEVSDLLSSIEGVVHHMMSGSRQDLLPEFRRWTEYFDRTRNQITAQVIPELAPILSAE
jgi:hypothetical protein